MDSEVKACLKEKRKYYKGLVHNLINSKNIDYITIPENLESKDIKSIVFLNDENKFHISWGITRWCNYNCPYCINTDTRLKEFTWIPEEQVLKLANKICEFINVNNIKKDLIIQFIGGEVTYYDLTKIFKIFKDNLDNNIDITIVTNFSRDNEYFKNLLVSAKNYNINLSISCSKHKENINFEEKFTEFNQWCISNNFQKPVASILVDNTFSEEIEKHIMYLRDELNWNINIQKKIKPEKTINLETDYSKEKDKQLSDFFNRFYHKEAKNANTKFKYIMDLGESGYKLTNNLQLIMTELKERQFIPAAGGTYYCDSPKNTLYIESNGDFFYDFCKKLRFKTKRENLFTSDLKNKSTWIECNEATNCPFCGPHSVINKSLIDNMLNIDKNNLQKFTIFTLNLNDYIERPLQNICIKSWYEWKKYNPQIIDIKIFDDKSPEFIEFTKIFSDRKYKYQPWTEQLADAFRMYILSKYENYLWLDGDVYINRPRRIWDIDFLFSRNWSTLYNGSNLEFYKKIFNIFMTENVSGLSDSDVVANFNLETKEFWQYDRVDYNEQFIHLCQFDQPVGKFNTTIRITKENWPEIYEFSELFHSIRDLLYTSKLKPTDMRKQYLVLLEQISAKIYYDFIFINMDKYSGSSIYLPEKLYNEILKIKDKQRFAVKFENLSDDFCDDHELDNLKLQKKRLQIIYNLSNLLLNSNEKEVSPKYLLAELIKNTQLGSGLSNILDPEELNLCINKLLDTIDSSNLKNCIENLLSIYY